MKSLHILIIILILAFSTSIFPQEVITGLNVNPVIKFSKMKPFFLKSAKTNDTIPFIDDFSYKNIFPSSSNWTDFNVFINDEYPLNQATIGVASFDALDYEGNIYKAAGSAAFSADTLTSIPIRLDTFFAHKVKPKAITKSDSLYFSFLYQPGGLGNAPEPDDSLVLEFYSPAEQKWRWIWSAPGTSFNSFKAYLDSGTYKGVRKGFFKTDSILFRKFNVNFKAVMIPITDSAIFFQKGFRFRFRNYASVANNYLQSWAAGNVDIWNIDYVYLDRNRSVIEKKIAEIAYRMRLSTMLKNYTSMPWKQYRADSLNETEKNISFFLRNFNDITRNVTQYLRISELPAGTTVFNPYPSGSTINFRSYSDTIFSPPLNNFYFSSKAEYPSFRISSYIRKEPLDMYHSNDTSSFVQKFNNYYAYDDGNPEAGYGLSVSDGVFASKFVLSKTPDSLSSVAIFFNPTFMNVNRQYFNLVVYNDNNGMPGSIIYEKENLLPTDSGYASGLDYFRVYHLDTLIPIKNKTFYVGIRQIGKDNINIGFDLNNDNYDYVNNYNSKLFYTIGTDWQHSIYKGSLMLRPVFGNYLSESIAEAHNMNNELKIFPNPAGGILNIYLSGTKNPQPYNIEIYSSLGRLIYSSPYQSRISVAGIPDGIYFIRLISNSRKSLFTRKIIINHK